MVGEREGTGHGFKEGHLVNPLIEQARNDSLEFFGTEKPIPQPPKSLLELISRLKSIGFTEVEGIYFPHASLGEGVTYPGWQTRIGTDYYAWLKAGQISKAFPELPGRWAIVDTGKRSNYPPTKRLKEEWEAVPSGTLQHPNDPNPESLNRLEKIIREARLREGGIERRDYWGSILPYMPLASRFGVSADEQDDIVFPELAEALGISDKIRSSQVRLRRPTLAELNYLGNLDRFSHLTQYGTSEAVQDVYKGILNPNDQEAYKHPRIITTGNTRRGGVGQVDYLKTDDHGDAVSFRFVIEFI